MRRFALLPVVTLLLAACAGAGEPIATGPTSQPVADSTVAPIELPDPVAADSPPAASDACANPGSGFDARLADDAVPPAIDWVDTPPKTVQEIAERSQLVVVARAQSIAAGQGYKGEPSGPWELVRVAVERVLRGRSPDVLTVRQLAWGDVPALAAGQRYLRPRRNPVTSAAPWRRSTVSRSTSRSCPPSCSHWRR